MSPAVVDIIGVLRRPQTATDRTGSAPLITAIGAGNQIDGVQTDAIRMVAPGFALVPARSIVTGPTTTAPDQLCLTNGAVVACSAATSVASNGLTMLTASDVATKLRGIVPDRVARVRFSPKVGKPVEAAVASNFYELVTPEVHLAAPPNPPDGFSGPPMTPPPLPVAGTVTWLDARGNAVGPTNTRIGY